MFVSSVNKICLHTYAQICTGNEMYLIAVVFQVCPVYSLFLLCAGLQAFWLSFFKVHFLTKTWMEKKYCICRKTNGSDKAPYEFYDTLFFSCIILGAVICWLSSFLNRHLERGFGKNYKTFFLHKVLPHTFQSRERRALYPLTPPTPHWTFEGLEG